MVPDHEVQADYGGKRRFCGGGGAVKNNKKNFWGERISDFGGGD